MLDLWRWQRLGERIGNHVCGGAIDESQFVVLDNPTNEMETDVDVFGTGGPS
jgi:hypothetical protein